MPDTRMYQTFSEKHIHWLMKKLRGIKKSLPANTELANGLGNLIDRFNLEIVSENSAAVILGLSSEKKFFLMVSDIADIWQQENVFVTEEKKDLSDRMAYANMLGDLLKQVAVLFSHFDNVNHEPSATILRKDLRCILNNVKNL